MSNTYTNRLGLAKPAQSDFYDIGVFNGNADTIDALTMKRPETATANRIAVFNSDKDVVDGGKTVAQLAEKASPATAGHLAMLTSGGGIADSGHALGEYAQKSALDILLAKMRKFTFVMPCIMAPSDVNHTMLFYFPQGYERDNTAYAVTIRLLPDNGENLEELIFGWGGDIKNNQGWVLVEAATNYVRIKFQSDDGIARNVPLSIGITGGITF